MQGLAYRSDRGAAFSPALCVRCDYVHKERLKALGGRWNPAGKCWELPYTPEDWQGVLLSIPGVKPDDAVRTDLTADDSDVGRPVPEGIPPMPLRAGITPFRHQLAAYSEAIERFRKSRGGYALLFEMGCGKSLTAVGIAGRLYLDGLISRVLVVAPLAVCPVWPRELADYAGFPHEVTVLEGDAKKKRAALEKLRRPSDGLRVAVVNYESVWRLEKELLEWAPEMIISDESQRIKDPMSRQSKAMHRLGDGAKYKLILSGTPVTNSPLDFYSQYRFLSRDTFGDSWYAFRARYAVTGSEVNRATGRSYTKILGYRNMPELVEKAHRIAYRVTKAAALDLPEQVDQNLYCELEPAARRAYDDLRRHSIAELDGLPAVTAQHVITRMLRLSQVCGGYVRVDKDGYEDDPAAGKLVQVSQAKRRLFEETARDILDAGKKLVVFARFTAEIGDIMAVLCTILGPDAVRLIDGSVPGAQRGQAVEDFQHNPSVRAFVAQLQTAGLGITLTAADTAIYYSVDYSYANYEQSRARIHRIGQKNACTYLHLLARDTIDEEVMNALKFKANVADVVVDRWRELLKK